MSGRMYHSMIVVPHGETTLLVVENGSLSLYDED